MAPRIVGNVALQIGAAPALSVTRLLDQVEQAVSPGTHRLDVGDGHVPDDYDGYSDLHLHDGRPRHDDVYRLGDQHGHIDGAERPRRSLPTWCRVDRDGDDRLGWGHQ